jgi:anti-anti-sigma factor
MTGQQRTGPAVLVPLAAEIDLTNCEQVRDQLSVAFIGGAPVVIADFTLTTFCDCATLRRLLDIQRQAAASHAEFRVAVPLASPVRRIMHMTGLDNQLQLYPTAAHAAAASLVPAPRIPTPPVRGLS